MSCAVCQRHQEVLKNSEFVSTQLPGGIIFQDQNVLVAHFPVLNPQAAQDPNAKLDIHLGHLIIELKRHIESLPEMTPEEAQSVSHAMLFLSQKIETQTNANHTYFFRIGDITKHLHFHLVPRYPDTPKEIWGVYIFQNPKGPKASLEDILELSKKLRVQ